MTEKNDELFQSYDTYQISLGEVLRGERATLGKTLEQVQADLKIKKTFIIAIEKCDLSGLDNRSFIAGYVRTYARYLGLDPESVYEKFCVESGFLSSAVNPFSPRIRKNGKKKIENALIRDNAWEPGKLGNKSDLEKTLFIPFLSKMIPVLSLLLVICGVGYWATSIILDLQRLEIVPIEQEPYQDVDLLGEIMEQGEELEKAERHLETINKNNDLVRENFLHNYYASKEELFPIVENRDSPIAKIDPNTSGIFLEDNGEADLGGKKASLDNPVSMVSNYEYEPLVVISPKVPLLRLVSLEKAWIRLNDEQGDVYLEKHFESGEEFIIPENLFSGSLRAGNATKVYFTIDGKMFGPISKSSSVVKNFSLDPLWIGQELVLIAEGSDLFGLYEEQKSQGLSTANKKND
ncbi:MAG: helix-turn-helix transcriptional regulator [Paracoccaceae bacterium]|nr:helix-turn-helix transcriptional regulator [Paracoccaceae bacterium]